MTEHLGHEKVATIEIPRDRAGNFSAVMVKKRQRRLYDVDATGNLVVRQGG